MKFDFEFILRKFTWSWVFRMHFNKRCLEYESGVWQYHNGYGRKGKHYSWGKRRPYKPIGVHLSHCNQGEYGDDADCPAFDEDREPTIEEEFMAVKAEAYQSGHNKGYEKRVIEEHVRRCKGGESMKLTNKDISEVRRTNKGDVGDFPCWCSPMETNGHCPQHGWELLSDETLAKVEEWRNKRDIS